MSDGTVSAPLEHVMWFVDDALDQMAVILRDLGDELANRRPALEGANSPYAILTHCLGVMEFWGGTTIVGRPIPTGWPRARWCCTSSGSSTNTWVRWS